MIGSLRARVQRLELAAPSPVRKFIVVAGLEEELDRAVLAALPGETMTILTGVPHAELQAPTIWEMTADGRWFLAEQDLAA
jgi:hypothetical protein